MNIKKKVLVWLTSAFLICTTIFGSLLNSHITKANNSPTNETSQELKKDNKEASNNETNNKKSSQENKSRTKRETQSSDKIDLTLKPLDKTTYQTQENITTYVEISGNSLSQPLEEGSVLEIEMPTTIHKQNMSRTTQAYLDNFSVATSNIPFIKETKLVEENGKTIYRIIFKKFDLTTKISIPYVFSFTDGLVPKDYKLKPIVRMKDNTGKVLVEKQDKEYNPIYPEMQANKNIAGNAEDNQVLYGGLSNKTDKTRISKDNAEPIPFNFSYRVQVGSPAGSERIIEKAIIKDTLPTYVNSEGQTVQAKFDPVLNPGWKDNGDGTVSYTKEYKITDYTDNIKVSNIILYLSFPDAKYKDNNGKPEFINKVEVTGIPFNPSTDEKYVAGDEIKFKINADDFSGTGILAKRSEHRTVNYDKNGLSSERLDYTIKVSNKLSKPMKEITLIEDASKYDQRLYITKIDSFYQRDSGSGAVVLNDKIEVRAYKDDNTYDVFKVNEELNKEAQDELNATAEKVGEGKISADDAQGITPKYKKITLYFKDYELPVGYYIEGQIYMAFKDPYHVEYSDKEDIKNVVSLDSKIGETTKVTAEDEYSKKFIPLNERITIGKQTQDQKTGIEGEIVNFAIFADFSSFSNYRYMKNPTFIDLLPKGVSKTDEVKLIEQPGSKGLVESWSVIENYNNSGRTAVKIVMKSGLAKDLVGDDQTKNYSFLLRYFKINKEIIPARAESDTLNNNNDLYFYFDNGQPFPSDVKADQLVEDTNDINMTGDTKDKVLKTQSKVIGNAPDSLTSTKYIRSVEPLVDGGDLYYGRSLEKEIETEYSGKTDKSGHFQYNLQVKNYYNSNLNKVAIYDVLPHENDNGRTNVSKTSAFSNILTGPIKLKVDSTDVTDKFDVYYRTDKYPSMDPKNEENSSSWTQNPTNYAEVTAFKIVSKSSFTLQPYKILHAIVDMKAPVYNENKPLTNKEAINTFHVKYNDDAYFAETNSVINRVVERTSVSVEKKWEVEAKDSAEVKLFADDKEVDKFTLNNANSWKHTFKNLPKYSKEDNHEISYTIKETPIEGYNTKITGSAKDGFVVTNTKRAENIKVQLKAKKTLEGKELKADKYEFELIDKSDNNKVLQKVKNSENGDVNFSAIEYSGDQVGEHKYVIREVEGTEPGVTYSKEEKEVTVTITKNSNNTLSSQVSMTQDQLNFTNKYIPKNAVIDVEATKLLTGRDAIPLKDGEFKFVLKSKDNSKVYKAENKADGKILFTGLTFDKAGEYDYVLSEEQGTDDTITYDTTEKEVKIKVTDDGNGQLTAKITSDKVTITNVYTPKKIKIPVTKIWDDHNNQDGKRPESIIVKLLADGNETNKTVELNAGNNWTAKFTDLDADKGGVPIKYTIAEVNVPKGYTSVTSGEAKTGFTITNSYTPEKTSVEGTKTWDDANNQDGKRPDKIKVILNKTVDGKTSKVAEKEVTKDNWSYEFTNLPKFEGGKEITYSIDEEAVAGYTKTIDGYNLKNSYTPEVVNVQGTKTWDDANNQDDKRPDKIKVILNKTVDGKTSKVAEKEVTKDNWNYEFTNLPKYEGGKEIKYSVKEVAVQDYTTEINNFNITNKHEPEKTSVEGTKTWDDANNQDGKRPTTITVKLYKKVGDKEKEEVTTKEVKADDQGNWKYKFDNLPKYEGGKEITYSIDEEAVPGYEKSIDGYNLKNSYTPEVVNVQGTKTWNDANNQDGKRPGSIKVILNKTVDGKTSKVAEKEVTAKDNWNYEFTNLPKYENGKVIKYSIDEVDVPGYEKSIKGYNLENKYIPPKPKLPKTGSAPSEVGGLGVLGLLAGYVLLRRKNKAN